MLFYAAPHVQHHRVSQGYSNNGPGRGSDPVTPPTLGLGDAKGGRSRAGGGLLVAPKRNDARRVVALHHSAVVTLDYRLGALH
jgi:hypothetical protein